MSEIEEMKAWQESAERRAVQMLIEEREGKPCPKCGQTDHGQTGEYPCPECGLPQTWDDPEPLSAKRFDRIASKVLIQDICGWLKDGPDGLRPEFVDSLDDRTLYRMAELGEPSLDAYLRRQNPGAVDIEAPPECVWNYCPTPELCSQDGCKHPRPISHPPATAEQLAVIEDAIKKCNDVVFCHFCGNAKPCDCGIERS